MDFFFPFYVRHFGRQSEKKKHVFYTGFITCRLAVMAFVPVLFEQISCIVRVLFEETGRGARKKHPQRAGGLLIFLVFFVFLYFSFVLFSRWLGQNEV